MDNNMVQFSDPEQLAIYIHKLTELGAAYKVTTMVDGWKVEVVGI